MSRISSSVTPSLLVSLCAACVAEHPPGDAGTPLDEGVSDVAALDAAGPDPWCPAGVRPALEACSYGLFWADCGGEGEPTFACGESGRCRWFASRCLAASFVASDCPLTDRCCHPSSDGEWPFASWRPPMLGAVRVQEDVGTIGATIVTAESPAAEIAVRPDAGISPSVPMRVVCSEPAVRVCYDAPRVERMREGSSRVLRFYTVHELEDLLVEVLESGRARVFVRDRSLFDSPPLAICLARGEGRPMVEATGTLAVTTLDPSLWSTVSGRLDVTIDGSRVEIDF